MYKGLSVNTHTQGETPGGMPTGRTQAARGSCIYAWIGRRVLYEWISLTGIL